MIRNGDALGGGLLGLLVDADAQSALVHLRADAIVVRGLGEADGALHLAKAPLLL